MKPFIAQNIAIEHMIWTPGIKCPFWPCNNFKRLIKVKVLYILFYIAKFCWICTKAELCPAVQIAFIKTFFKVFTVVLHVFHEYFKFNYHEVNRLSGCQLCRRVGYCHTIIIISVWYFCLFFAFNLTGSLWIKKDK